MAEVTRRSTRKRRAVVQEDAATEEDVDAAIVSEESEHQSSVKVRPKKTKRQRTEAHVNKPPFETIPAELLPTIMLFLDSARDIYNLANCSKQLRKAITPEIVVRSAVFSGGKTRAAIADVMNAIKRRSIRVPSTLRLLRLVNAKRCERLGECFAYDLVKKVSADCSKSGKRPFGLSICPECAKAGSVSVSGLYFVLNYRVAAYQHRVLYEQHSEASTGEQAGPLVFVKEVLQIKNSYKNEGERNQALIRVLKTVDENTPSEDEARAKALLDAYKKAEQDWTVYEEAKQRAVQGQRAVITTERAFKKMKKVRDVYARLEQLLDGYAHKDLVLECSWDERFGICTLKHTLAKETLRLLNAPSGATQKKLIAAVDSVREAFDIVQSKGFMEPNFLSFLSNSQLRHEKALYRWCLAKKTSSALLCHRRANSHFLELLRADNLVSALLLVLDSSDLMAIFASRVACERFSSSPQAAGALSQQESLRVKNLLANLAALVWSESITGSCVRDADMFREKFAQCRIEFISLTVAVRRYMEDPQTVAFLSETGPPPDNPNQVFTRQNAVDKVYKHVGCFRFLRQGDFASLRNLHQRMFLRPEAFGYSRNGA